MSHKNVSSSPAVGSKRPHSRDTPTKTNMSSTNIFFNGDLEDLGSIPEVTADFMLKNIVPKSNININKTMERLREAGLWSEKSGWKEFEGKKPSELANLKQEDPSTSEHSDFLETKIFQRLKKIYHSIILHAQFDHGTSRTQSLAFEQSPYLAPVSDTNVMTRPDGYGVLTTTHEMHTEHVHEVLPTPGGHRNTPSAKSKSKAPEENQRPDWFDIACVEEYKLWDRSHNLEDDVRKIIWNMHHVMHVDCRRRFIFGLTIEDTTTRIWFACRQTVFVTKSFDFSTNPSKLVHLIASLAYATPLQLGYDPTMTLHEKKGKAYSYNIQVKTKQPDGSMHTVLYNTQKTLCDTAYNLRGRATRVYLAEAFDLNIPSTPKHLVALKDAWIDAERPKEGDILSKLLEGASEKEKKLFLTVYQHGVVQIDNRDDSTEDLILNGKKIESPDDAGNQVGIFDPTADSKLIHKRRKIDTESKPAHSADALRNSSHLISKTPIVYAPKVHYRIAFEEVGESLMQIADSHKLTATIVSQAIGDSIKAIQHMAKRGYVHRDIGIRNILWFGNHAKIFDLETAKKYNSKACANIRTDPLHFTAGEVMVEAYWMSTSRTVPFMYNPIHDLESVWWVGVWCTIWHYPAPFEEILPNTQHGPDKDDSTINSPRFEYKYRPFNATERKHIDSVKRQAEELFPSSQRPGEGFFRMDQIHHQKIYSECAQTQRYPPLHQTFMLFLDEMRHLISCAYEEIVEEIPSRDAAYFTDVLRIPVGTDPDVKKPVHDCILERLSSFKQQVTEEDKRAEDAILWPLEYFLEYEAWVEERAKV